MKLQIYISEGKDIDRVISLTKALKHYYIKPSRDKYGRFVKELSEEGKE